MIFETKPLVVIIRRR